MNSATAGVDRVEIKFKDNEFWIYYSDEVNLNNVMAPVASGEVKTPNLILNKEPGCDITSITVEDFEMQNYEPMQPQLTFELGI